MCDDHHHICAFFTHFRHILTRGFGDIVDGHFAAEIGFIPGHDLRRHKTDIADTQRLRFAVAILHRRFFNQVRRKHRLTGFGIDNIGVYVGKFRPGERLVQEIKAVVELVIAEVTYRVVQRIHCLIYRVDITAVEPFGGHVVTQRTSLNNIAVIDQHAVFDFLAGLFYQRSGAHEAKFFRCGVFVVVEIHHIAMQIGGFHNSQIDRRGVHAGGNQRGQ